MRIIGGELGGRRLMAPKGSATRPTSDRVRESLFSILGPPAPDAVVLDLFAGAGTLGLEALSRGAATTVFVESSKPAIATIRQNISTLALASRTTVISRSLPSALSRPPISKTHFDWVFIDPPYVSEHGLATLEAVATSSLLAADATVVFEHDRRREPADAVGCLVRTDCRRYGDTELSFYQQTSDLQSS